LADIQSLYLFSMAVIHVLTCTWYGITEGSPSYMEVSEYDLLGNYVGGDVSKKNGYWWWRQKRT